MVLGLLKWWIDKTEIYSYFRDIREYKSRVESYSREMLRKEAQIRDMTQRLENGEGSKSIFEYLKWVSL